MQTLTEIRTLLAERGLQPRKRFGQNFLHDHNLLRRLVDAAELDEGGVVLEVGPGTGTLTETLLDVGATVIACEIDRDLGDLIDDRLGDRITLVRGDCLDGRTLSADVRSALDGRPFSLVANLPYQAASPLMAGLLLDHPECRVQCVTIQNEVADRLLAQAGTKAYGPLGIIVQSLAQVDRIATLPPTCFWPAPQVTSAMVRLTPHAADHPFRTRLADPQAFATFVTQLFTRRRKQLGTILGRDGTLPESIDPKRRPETLTIEELIEVFERTRGE